jgi:hypothetical protein
MGMIHLTKRNSCLMIDSCQTWAVRFRQPYE